MLCINLNSTPRIGVGPEPAGLGLPGQVHVLAGGAGTVQYSTVQYSTVHVLVVQGSVFILATLLVEAGAWRRLVCWWRRGQREADTGDSEDKDLDEDVVKERLRVLSGKDADVLQVKNLFKRQVFIVAKKGHIF